MTARSFVRNGHGAGAGRPHVENPRDELPPGVPAPPPPAALASGDERPIARDANGRPADRAAAAEMGRRSARARAEKRSMLAAWTPRKLKLGTHQLFETRKALERFADEADAAFNAKCEEIARDVGGGYCGVGVRACIRQWAHAHYGALAMFEMAMGPLMFGSSAKEAAPKLQADIYATATKMAAEARGSLLCAHSLASAEAAGRAARLESSAGNDAPWLLRPETKESP